MKRLYLLSMITLMMAVAILPLNVKAQVSVWNGTAELWTHGNGTKNNPYLIETASQLAGLSEMVSSGQTYSNKYFKLTINLNMNNLAWIPIGNSTYYFCGHFDGDNHFIDNIKISGNYTYGGLFGRINLNSVNAGVENVGVKTTVTGTCQYAGGIAGYVYGSGGVLRNCYNTGDVRASGSSSIENVYAGGIVGFYQTFGRAKITDCYNSGNVVANYSGSHGHAHWTYSGGICGYLSYGSAQSSTTFYNCHNTGRVFSYTYNSYYNSTYSYVSFAYSGGILGFNNNSYATTDTTIIDRCYNTGVDTSYSKGTYNSSYNSNGNSKSGGILAGASSSGSYLSIVRNCYNRGRVSAIVNDIYDQTQAYGIANDSRVYNCYNAGYLTAYKKYGVGSGTISNSYYLETCGHNQSGGTSKTATSMKSATFPAILNSSAFMMDGSPNINGGYPVLGSVTTKPATQVLSSQAILHGEYVFTANEVGYQYKKSTASSYSTVYDSLETPSSHQLTGLQSNTEYTFRFFVKKGGSFFYGQPLTFTTGTPGFCDFIVSVSPASKVICEGDSVILTAVVQAASAYSNQLSYSWDTGETTPSISVNSGGWHSVSVSDSINCAVTSSAYVTVNLRPAVYISGITTLCDGESSTLTASVSGGYSYVWSNGAANTPSIIVSNGGTYSVTATNLQGCSSSASVQVTSSEEVSISGNTTLCIGESSTLTASGGNSYVWNTGASTPSITVSNGGTYSVTAINSYGCSSSASVLVTSIENVSISGNLNICQGQSTTLYANGTGSYLWSTGATTSSVTVTQAGLYTVTVSLGNCSSSASALVSIAANPVPTISGNTTICQGETSLLIANGGNSYVWSNGSASNSIGVSQSGTYSVTATSMEGCTGSTSVFVTINPLPNVNISGNNSFCQGSSVVLTASGASSYSWSDGSSNTTITVSNPGTYTLIGTDANNCMNTATKTVTANPTYNVPISHSICQGESYNFNGQYLTTAGTYTHNLSTVNGCDSIVTLHLTVNSLPTPAILGNTSLCQGQSTSLSANGGVSYAWSNGSTNNNISVSQSGVYTVTATNAEGCSATANVTVTVNPLPNVSISGNNSFCQGDNVTLIATGANTYLWSNASSNAAITVSNAGTYTVTGTDANGCTNTATKTVTVNPTYNIPLTHSMCEGESYNFYGQNITTAGTYTHTLQTVNGCDSVLTLTVTLKALPPTAITGNNSLCEDETTTLTATGGVTYVWSNTSTGNSITVSQSGVYTVTATNAEGCSATANVTVTVNPLPTITVGGNTTVCAGNSTMLTASGANSYSWSTGDNTASVNIDAFGVYSVTGTSSEGCSNTASVTVLVSQSPNITITGMTDICAGESTTLTANGGETYLWSDGTTNNNITVSTAGTYQVIGYNAEGCNAMASATVSVWQPATSEFSISTPDSCYTWNAESYCTSGDYTQTFQTVHGCDSVVTLHLTITVGIDDHHLAASMTVYPNPTTGILNVECTMNNVQAEKVEFQLFDAFGRLLRSTDDAEMRNFASPQTDTHGSVQTQIDLSHYASGTYFVKAVADGCVIAVRKVIKN